MKNIYQGMLIAMSLMCTSIFAKGENVKTVPHVSITTPANGLAGMSIPLTIDKGGSTGVVTWTLFTRDGTASISGDQLLLTGAGTIELKADVAEDENYFAGSATMLINIIASEESNPMLAQVRGVSAQGGPGDAGSLFRMNSDGTGYTVMQQFVAAPTGINSFYNATMVGSDSKIYGTLINGREFNGGVLYVFDPATHTYTVLYDFQLATGSQPNTGLVEIAPGKFLGGTNIGGPSYLGVLFTFNVLTGDYEVVHNFTSTTGQAPCSAPTLAPNGKILWGNTLRWSP
jgi:uncharacterized repeat protein (TIGR03803 family)